MIACVFVCFSFLFAALVANKVINKLLKIRNCLNVENFFSEAFLMKILSLSFDLGSRKNLAPGAKTIATSTIYKIIFLFVSINQSINQSVYLFVCTHECCALGHNTTRYLVNKDR